MKIYTSEEWLDYVCSAAHSMLTGIVRLLWSVIIGIISLLVYVYRVVAAFCKREKLAALIIAFIFAVLIFGWITTFMSERAARVDAEYQRDSLSLTIDSLR